MKKKRPGRRYKGGYRRTKSFPPDRAFAHALGLLNSANVSELWKTCARLSLHDAFTDANDPFFVMPALNSEKIRLFVQAVIASHADHTKTRFLSEDELRNVLDDCNDAMQNPEALARLKRANQTERAYVEFQRFLSQLANVQFPQQVPRPRVRTGRAIGMLEVLPWRYQGLVPAERRQEVFGLLERIRAYLGVSLTAIAECFIATLACQQVLGYSASRRALELFFTEYPLPDDPMRRQGFVLSGLLRYEPRQTLDKWLLFEPERIAGLFAIERATEFLGTMAVFLGMFSRTTSELRALAGEREFQVGHLSSRLSPLERYPIVRLEGPEPKLIIPHILHLAKSAGPVFDFTLLAQFGEEYSQVRGVLQELYLRRLFEERLPDLVLVPEVTYGREERKGPDLTIIDRRHGRIILLESKGRRVSLESRLTMRPDLLARNLEDAYSALLGLPRKLQDLYAGLREYEPYQGAIDSTRGSEPIFVVALSEGAFFLSHLLRLEAELPGDRLHGFAQKYCVLSVESLELAVEIARIQDQPLYELLEAHYARSGSHDFTEHHADDFGGAVVDDDQMFAAQFSPPWPRISQG